MRLPRLNRKRALALVACVSVLELGLLWTSHVKSSLFFRAAVPAPSTVELVRMGPQFDPLLGWRIPYRTSLGHRPGGDGAPSWFAAFGGSLVHGDGVENNRTWESVLARRMGQGVFNFGVTDFSPDQALLRAQLDVKRSAPDVAALGVSGRDIDGVLAVYRRFQVPTAPPFSKPRFYALNGTIHAFANPVTMPGDLSRLSDPAFLERLGKYDRWYNPSRLPVASFPYGRALLNPRFWFRAARRAPDSDSLWADDEPRAIFLWIVDHFVREARKQEADPVIMLMPAREDVEARLRGDFRHGYFFLLSHCSVRRYRCFDAVQAFAWKVESGADIATLYKGDNLSEEGNRLFGDSLGDYLIADASLGLNG